MTDRPTPETDKIIPDWMQGVTKELPNFVEIARKMERERDEARKKWKEQNEALRTLAEHGESEMQKLIKERDEAREERDIARLETEEISQELANARKQIEGLNNFANERYEEIQKVRKERDEARKVASGLAEQAKRLRKERDEAIRQRDETNTSSKYACDYNYEQKLKAERERDEAREALENHMAATIHTCHDECKRPMCVLRRERDEAREALRELYFAVQRKFAEWAPKNDINAASEEAAK